MIRDTRPASKLVPPPGGAIRGMKRSARGRALRFPAIIHECRQGLIVPAAAPGIDRAALRLAVEQRIPTPLPRSSRYPSRRLLIVPDSGEPIATGCRLAQRTARRARAKIDSTGRRPASRFHAGFLYQRRQAGGECDCWFVESVIDISMSGPSTRCSAVFYEL